MNDNRVFFDAIATRRCITAIYNRGKVVLAPHILYARHDDLFVDATTVERDGRPPRERKLGTFKVTGLGDTCITDIAFDPDPAFEKDAERYDEILFAVEQAA